MRDALVQMPMKPLSRYLDIWTIRKLRLVKFSSLARLTSTTPPREVVNSLYLAMRVAGELELFTSRPTTTTRITLININR